MEGYCEITLNTNLSSANGTYKVPCNYIQFLNSDGANTSSSSISVFNDNGSRISFNSLDNTGRYYSNSSYNYTDVVIQSVDYNYLSQMYYYQPFLIAFLLLILILKGVLHAD